MTIRTFGRALPALAALAIWLATAGAAPLAAQERLRFVGDRDYPPLSFVVEGEPRGFDVDVLRAVGAVLGRPIDIELTEWAAAQEAVRSGAADGLTDLAMSDERRRVFEFADATIVHEYGLFVRAGDTRIADVADLAGKRIGVTRGGFPREFVERQRNATAVIVANYDEGFARLVDGSLDAIAADTWVGGYTVEKARISGVALATTFASVPAAIAVRREETALAADINRALVQLRADGTLQRIQDRWRPQQMVFLTRSRFRNLQTYSIGGFVLLLFAGTVVWALTLQRQVRVRRALTAAVDASNQRLNLALAAADMGGWQWSADTNQITYDASLMRLLGREPVERTLSIEEALAGVHPEDRDQVGAAFAEALASGAPYDAEFRIVRPDGAIRWHRVRGKAIAGPDGAPLTASGITLDRTREHENDARIRLLAHAVKSASDAVAIVDANERVLYVNDAFVRVFEYEPSEIVGQSIDLVRAAEQTLDPALVNLTTSSDDKEWRGEILSRSKSGRLFPISLATSLVRDDRGVVVARIGLSRDISHEKAAEEALRASEEKFFKAFEASPDGIVIQNAGGELISVNESFATITGYARADLIGHRPQALGLFLDPLGRDLVADAVRKAGSARDVEYRIRRKNGETATLLGSGSALEIGGHACILIVSRDVTDRRRFELHLRQAAELNKLLLSEMDLDGLAVAIVESVHQILTLDYAALALYEPSGELQVKAQRGIADAVQLKRAGHALAAHCLARNRLQVLRRDDLIALGAPAAALVDAGFVAACALPLATARGSLGAVVVASTSASAFSSDDVTLLHQLATYAAIALQNAESFDEIRTLKDQIAQEKLYLEEEIRVDHNFADIVGDSPAIKRVLQQIETVAPTSASVLILGETGTGKELLARAIHQLSPRRDRTFVRMNAAALPASLLESELFGHERGAFTGATSSRVGRMELAHRGTLFLDEVGDIPMEVQPKLLRALQEKEFERLGSTRTQTVDVRLIAATNRDLAQMVQDGTFRSDLYYRLNVFPLQVPPLRERHGDIPILVRYFVQKFSARLKRRISTIPAAAMQALEEWSWPGNIRELENVIERAVILSSGDVLQLPPFQMAAPVEPERTMFVGGGTLGTFADGEREIILRALRDAEGVIGGPDGAAARLGIKRTTLQSKMRKLGIRRPTF